MAEFHNGTPIAAHFSGAEKQLSRDLTAYWAGFVTGREHRCTFWAGGGPDAGAS